MDAARPPAQSFEAVVLLDAAVLLVAVFSEELELLEVLAAAAGSDPFESEEAAEPVGSERESLR